MRCQNLLFRVNIESHNRVIDLIKEMNFRCFEIDRKVKMSIKGEMSTIQQGMERFKCY